MPPNDMNENSGSALHCRPIQQSVQDSVSNEGRISYLPSVHSSIAQVCESSAIHSDKHGSVEKSGNSSSILSSNVDDNAVTSVGAVISATQDNLASDSRRRRASTRNYITVSCHLLFFLTVIDFL